MDNLRSTAWLHKIELVLLYKPHGNIRISRIVQLKYFWNYFLNMKKGAERAATVAASPAPPAPPPPLPPLHQQQQPLAKS